MQSEKRGVETNIYLRYKKTEFEEFFDLKKIVFLKTLQ